MIDRDRIAEVARNTDALVEEIGLTEWCRLRGIDLQGLAYVAQQRALRMVMIQEGISIPKGEVDPSVVHISRSASERIPTLAAIWMDAFAVGMVVAIRSK